jgi:hypothetical protein
MVQESEGKMERVKRERKRYTNKGRIERNRYRIGREE